MNTGKMKVNKKKKVVGGLVADCIDNNASVHSIFENLRHKNKQAYLLCTQTLRQRCTTKSHLVNFHFNLPGHPLNAVSDDWDGQLHTSYFQPFRHKSFPPKMLSTMKYIGKSDPVTDHLKLKHNWHRDCKSLRQTAVLGKMTEKYEELNDDVVMCPKHLVDMAAHMDSDPDPYFDSHYNWYYAGSGNIQLICINQVDYLLHSEFSCVFLTEFNKVHIVIGTENIAEFDCGMHILETIYSSQNIVALRARNKVFILKINANDSILKFEILKVAESELPYTGISFDHYHKNILYLATLDHNLSIVNLDRMSGVRVKLKAHIRTLVDNWNTVVSTERAYYMHIGRKSISLYDKRSNDVAYLWTDIKNLTDEMHCHDVSAALQSDIGPLVYASTQHNLFLMDIRYCDRQKLSAVKRWTHGTQCVPTYIKKCNFVMDQDLVCLSSQWCEDVCVVPSFKRYNKGEDMCNLTVPYRPPSILKTLEEARVNKLCRDIYNPIDSRLLTAISGCVILEEGENYAFLLQNSLGDVSLHTIFPDHMEPLLINDSYRKLHEWTEPYKLPAKQFEVSSVVDIAHVWKKLRKVPESYITTREGKTIFNEKEIFDTFEKEDLDSGLLDVWMQTPDDTAIEQSTTGLDIHFSDCE